MQIKFNHARAHLAAAANYATLSHSKRLKVGCVIVREDTPIALGWNGMPPGFPNECEDLINGELVTKRGCRHAEINALNKLRRSNESATGAISFQTHAPCLECAIDLVEARIAGVVYSNIYRSSEGIEYLLSKNVPVYRYVASMDLFGIVLHRAEGGTVNLMQPGQGPLEF